MNKPTPPPYPHNICRDCWEARHGMSIAARLPARDRRYKFCCFCALINRDGIFIDDAEAEHLTMGHDVFHARNEEQDNVIA